MSGFDVRTMGKTAIPDFCDLYERRAWPTSCLQIAPPEYLQQYAREARRVTTAAAPCLGDFSPGSSKYAPGVRRTIHARAKREGRKEGACSAPTACSGLPHARGREGGREGRPICSSYSCQPCHLPGRLSRPRPPCQPPPRGKEVTTITSASSASSGWAWNWSKSCRKRGYFSFCE